MLPSKEINIGYINAHRDWYIINKEYQRDSSIWSLEDKRQLIDTILKDLDIPKFYLRQVDEKKYEIVDGQQRISTIWDFKDNKFALEGSISGNILDGIKYKELSSDLIEQFDNFQLTCVFLINYNDEKTRELFSKLQRGKPLNPAEKLNAFPGKIVPTMRNIGRHDFFEKVTFPLHRYKTYHLIAKLMLLEYYGITDLSPQNIYDFFKKNENLNSDSKIAINIKKVLNFLNISFSDKTPEINNDSWFISLYLLTSNLLDNYNMKGRNEDLKKFYINFWKSVEQARNTGEGSKHLFKYVEANRAGTTSKKNINIRNEIIQTRFIKKYSDLELLDENRFFNHFEKTFIFRRDKGICQDCGEKVNWDEYNADHIKAHIKGGGTKIKNGQVLCSKCNKKKGAK